MTTAVEKELSKLTEGELYLTLPKKQLDELGDWSLYQAFNRWVEDRRVNVVLAESGDDELTIQKKILLNWYVNHPNVKLYSVQKPPMSNGVLLASVVDDAKACQWGYISNDARTLISGTDSFNKPTLFDSSRLSFEGGSLTKVVLHEELNGAAKDFGFKFWSHVFKHSPELMALMKSQQLQLVTYSDRYLAAPLPLSLCFSALKFIGEHYKGCTTQVVTGELTRSAKPRTVQDNFEDEYSRDKVFRLIADATEADISFRSRPKYELPHARVLELVFDSGAMVTLWLDQGFGYWYADKYLPENQLESDVSEENLVGVISEGQSIIRSGKFPTDVFLSYS